MFHLAQGLTTLNTKKRKKKKVTLSMLSKYEVNMRKHNKEMKRIGCHNLVMNIKEYINYCQGNYKPKNREQRVISEPWHQSGKSFERPKENIQSHTSKKGFEPALKREPMQYTGERRLVGIATMHKSNMVPIFADDDDKTGSKQATEIATMRRN